MSLSILLAGLAFGETAGIKSPAGPGAGLDIAAKAKAGATASLPEHPPQAAIDDKDDTSWRSAEKAVFWVDLGARMRLAGVAHDLGTVQGTKVVGEVVAWSNGWKTIRRTTGSGKLFTVPFVAETQYIGIRSAAGQPGNPVMLSNWRVFQAGWRPQRNGKDLRLQDFCFFRHKGCTYIASMMKDFCREGITVARSRDLVHWQPLGLAVDKRTAEDKAMVWAPHVVEHDGQFHMFYTGVTEPAPGQWKQCILVASTTDPNAPKRWQRNPKVRFIVGCKTQSWFRPSHPGHVWPENAWADCRDPMVFFDQKAKTWYLFYSGSDQTGGIVGAATAPDVLGPWVDRGAVLHVDKGVPESSFVLPDPKGGYIMVVNHSVPDRKGGGIKVARGSSLLPDNGRPSFANLEILSESASPGLGGWAHEFALNPDGTVLAAYLTGYWINFQDARFTERSQGWTLSGIADQSAP